MNACLRELFEADVVGAGTVDLLGTSSRRWATNPAPVDLGSVGFHELAIHHPILGAYRRSQETTPLRLSDVSDSSDDRDALRFLQLVPGISRVITIPLAVSALRISVIAIMRSGRDFATRDMLMAQRLQPIVAGIYALQVSDAPGRPRALNPAGLFDDDLDIRLTERELVVLGFLSSDLIPAAIARRLDMSPRTLDKHIQHIYRKFDTRDRTSTVLKAQNLGFFQRS